MRLCALNNIEAKTTGTEAHSSLGLGERYHDPLRNTFRKMKVSYPDTPDDYLLFVAVKAMNDTLGPSDNTPGYSTQRDQRLT